jgi:hypothetical protein
MGKTLFALAGPGIVAWVLLIFLPRWRVSRWVAESGIFPAYLAVLYVLGVAPLVVGAGPGLMADFGSAEGVVKLLARPEGALIAWIHILVFDQVVGHVIYLENMRHRYVSLPLQSVILFLTLMFGPVGFLLYYTLRFVRRTRDSRPPASAPQPPPSRSGSDEMEGGQVVSYLRRVWREERALIALGILGVVLGLIDVLIIRVQGALVPPGGDLTKAATFCLALGIYLMTLAPLLPVTGFSARGRSIWITLTAGAAIYSYAIENIQIFRGIDPRFNNASPPNQLAGLFFFLSAILNIVLFLVLAVRFFGARHQIRRGALLAGVRYGIASVFLGFAAGMWMSLLLSGRQVDPSGSALPIHALGFHGMQAVPLVALLALWSRHGRARLVVHAAGAAWLAAALAVFAQAAAGYAPAAPALPNVVAAVCLALWLAIALWAALGGSRPAPAPVLNR